MAQAAVTLLLIITIRGAFGAVTVAADLAHPGRQGRPSGAAPSHGKAKLHSADSELSGDAEPHGVHSAHQGEGAELHRTAGHTHHATAADLARQEKHASAAHVEDAPKVVEEGAKGPKSGEAAEEASGDEDAEELEAAEDDAEGFEGPEEGPQPQRSRRHEFAVDAAGEATEAEQRGRVIMRRHNHTEGAASDEGYLEEEESLVQEDADLAEQARRSGWWSRRRAPPRRRRAPPPPPPPAVIHCAWASWGKWGACSATCGEGKQSTTRKAATLARNGGTPCNGETTKSQTCQIKKCTTTSTTTTSTTTTTTTTTTKKVVKAGASRPVGGGVLALPALALALSLL